MTIRFTLFFYLLFSLSTLHAADWPQFRGPDRNNISRETGLLRNWPAGGPKVLWETSVAQGYAGAAIKNGLVYINDYDESTKEDLIRCLSLENGKEVWQYRNKVVIRPNHGITRTVPSVGDKLVFSLDPKCRLFALDAKTGDIVWQKNLVQEYKTLIPQWYAGQNPLLDGDRVLIATGGDSLVVALDQATGKEIWKSANPENDVMSHASLMPATIGGVKQYLYVTMNKVVGVAAADGKLLWTSPFPGRMAVSPSPVYVGNGKVFVTSAYEVGSAMYQVQKTAAGFTAQKLFELTSKQFNSEVHTPILHKNHLFAVGSKNKGQFTCLDLDGNIVWQSPASSESRLTFEMGGFLLADGMFFALDGLTGTLRLIDANITEYKELASAQILEGHDVWAPPALSNGRLIIRDLGRMVCLQVGK
jgi:outer membrane protein assembly factor BamB